jgi:hypothetical protein
VFAPEDARRVAALRIGLCGVLALRLTRTVYVRLADQPRPLFRPLSFMRAFDSMPPRAVVLAVQAVALVATVLACVGWRARATLPVAWAGGVFLGGMTTSLGKVVHNDVLLLLAMVPLLVARTSDAWALDARGRARPGDDVAYGWPVRTAMLVVAGAYFFAGFAKVVNAGPGWVTNGNLRWVMYAASDARSSPNPLALFVADRPWLAHLVAASVLLVELAFPLVLFSARLRRPFVAATLAMHLAIWLTIGLDYWAQAATVVVVLTDWPRLAERVRVRRVARGSPSRT